MDVEGGNEDSSGNKYDDVSVIYTYIGSSVENRIFRSRHPEMISYTFVCRCVCNVIMHL